MVTLWRLQHILWVEDSSVAEFSISVTVVTLFDVDFSPGVILVIVFDVDFSPGVILVIVFDVDFSPGVILVIVFDVDFSPGVILVTLFDVDFSPGVILVIVFDVDFSPGVILVTLFDVDFSPGVILVIVHLTCGLAATAKMLKIQFPSSLYWSPLTSVDCMHMHTLYSAIPHNIKGVVGSSINSLLHCPSFQMSTTIHKTLVCPSMSQSQRLVPRNETPTAMPEGFHPLLSLK